MSLGSGSRVIDGPVGFSLAVRAGPGGPGRRDSSLPHNYLTNALQLAQDPFWSAPWSAGSSRNPSAAAEGLDSWRWVFPIRELRRLRLHAGRDAAISLVVILLAFPTVKTGYAARVRPGGDGRGVRDVGISGTHHHGTISRLLQIQITVGSRRSCRNPPSCSRSGAGRWRSRKGRSWSSFCFPLRPMPSLELKTLAKDPVALQGDAAGLRYRAWTPAADGGYALAGACRKSPSAGPGVKTLLAGDGDQGRAAHRAAGGEPGEDVALRRVRKSRLPSSRRTTMVCGLESNRQFRRDLSTVAGQGENDGLRSLDDPGQCPRRR